MWHEARRREKATQKLLNDHKKRAEKRREENRIDPNSLLQIHGLKAKVCLEPCIYKQAIKSLVAWQGDKSVTIDRFDVRATLSSIPSCDKISSPGSQQSRKPYTVLDADESEANKKLLSYERYRILIQNDLAKVSEERRLKLVSQSEASSTDAKLRKLRNNKFGTSGDASVSTANNPLSGPTTNIINKLTHSRLDLGHAAKLIQTRQGPSYNAVPPPASLLSNKVIIEPLEEQETQNSPDLDDQFDLDSVNVANFEPGRINEIAKKYGLSSDELVLLAKRDGRDVNIGEVLKELSRLNKKSRANNVPSNVEEQMSQVYGPALPPELAHIEPSSPSVSSPCSPPIQQRSPSGADIPLRGDESLAESSCHSRQTEEGMDGDKSERKATAVVPKPETKAQTTESSSSRTTKPHQEDLNRATNRRAAALDGSSSPGSCTSCCSNQPPEAREPEVQHRQTTRRASTPLAYKRNCRSSLSLSRERRRSSNYKSSSSSHKRPRRSNRSSSSSSSSTSSTSCSSYTSSSFSRSCSSSRSSRSASSSRRTQKRNSRPRTRRKR